MVMISWCQHRQVRVRYEYPNRDMYQHDEKAQQNRFLGEWLSHCLNHGHACETVTASLSRD